MAPLSQNDCRALLSAVEKLYGIISIEQFAPGVFSAIREILSCDVMCYNEVSLPDSNISWLMDPASALPGPGLREIFERHLSEHPLFAYYVRTGDGRSHRISDFLSQRQFHGTGLYSEFYKPSDVEFQLGTIIPLSACQIIGIALDRDRTDFSENERLRLDLIRPHLLQTYRNVQTLDIMKRAVEEKGSKLLIVSRSGQVRLASDDVWRTMAKYFDAKYSHSSLPDMLNNWINHERLRFGNESDISSPSVPLVLNNENGKLTVHFLWGGKAAEQDLLLLEEKPALALSLSDDSKLTRRETEILAWLSQGKTNAEIGLALSISPRTVKKHLEHIYSKLQVHRRSAAVARYHYLL